jgi:hypothetical protein
VLLIIAATSHDKNYLHYSKTETITAPYGHIIEKVSAKVIDQSCYKDNVDVSIGLSLD